MQSVLPGVLRGGDVLMVKASNGTGLGRVVAGLREAAAQGVGKEVPQT